MSLYNRVIQTFGISMETWNPHKQDFSRRGDPILRSLCEKREAKRNVFKRMKKDPTLSFKERKAADRTQKALKTILLTYYGVVGMAFSRFYNPDIAEQITQFSAMLIIGEEILEDPKCPIRPDLVLKRGAKQILEDFDMELLYGDTDSVFFKLLIKGLGRDNIETIMEAVINAMNAEYEPYFKRIGLPPEFRRLEMELQGFYSVLMLSEAKKKYYAIEEYSGDLMQWLDKAQAYYKGLELVKGDSTQFTLFSEHGFFNMAAKMIKNNTIDEEKIFKFLQNQYKILMSGRLNKHLVIAKSTKEDLDDYLHTSPHVRAAKIAEEAGEFMAGDKIEFVVISNHRGKIVSRPVINDIIPRIEQSGLQYYWDRKFFNYITPFLSSQFDVKALAARIRGQQSLSAFI